MFLLWDVTIHPVVEERSNMTPWPTRLLSLARRPVMHQPASRLYANTNCCIRQARGLSSAAAVTPSEFASHLTAVGLSKDAVHQMYKRGDRQASRQPRYPLAVALSGGADSMALMLLLNEFLRSLDVETPLLAITVDHRLRVESGDEVRYVGGIAMQQWGVRHVVMECDWEHDERRGATPRKSKLQEEARSFRYELLTRACVEHGVNCLFVAHNLGDQLETVLFRLGRASGTSGLAGISPTSSLGSGEHRVALVRPLLSVSKASLKATCERFSQPWVEDPSNESLLFDRIRIRKALERLELQSEYGKSSIEALRNFQQAAARAKREFEARESELMSKYVVSWEPPSRVVISTAMLSDSQCFDEMAMRVLSSLVRDIGRKEKPPRLSSLEGLLRDVRGLASGKKVTLSGCQITMKRRGSELHFEPEQQERSRKPL